jgi:hypothetical protein
VQIEQRKGFDSLTISWCVGASERRGTLEYLTTRVRRLMYWSLQQYRKGKFGLMWVASVCQISYSSAVGVGLIR